MIELVNLVKKFGDLVAVAGISLTVRPGETIEVSTNLPIGPLGKFGDLNEVFGKHRTAVRITAKRLW